MAFVPRSRLVISGSWDHTLKIWDATTGAAIRTLDGHADRINCVTVTLDGPYTLSDSTGPVDYNQKLSEQRAEAVQNYLLKVYAIDANRLTTEGYGETKPIASNDTDEGRFKNRRVEFIRIE